jgi:hypothetical protein
LPAKRKAKKGAKKKAKRTVKKKPKMKIKAWETEKKEPQPATEGIKAWETAEPAQAQPPTSTPAETQPATEGSQPSSSEM